MVTQANFSDFDYLIFSLDHKEKSIVAPAPFGRKALIEFAATVCAEGVVTHKFSNNLAPVSFSNLEELSKIFGMSIAHSEWFISFRDGSRGFFDFDDDFLVILFDESKSDLLAKSLKVDELYRAASRELAIIRTAARSREHVLRFETFIERAIHAGS
jgi:hypothetical protein